jgi:multidrug efflux pump subunit AcrB
MRYLINICVKRPVTVIMALFALFTGGIMSAVSMPLNKLPEVNSARIIVETAYPGMSAEEVRSLVTIPVEDALSPVKGLERISSISRTGASVITLDFRWGADVQSSAVLVREAVDTVYPALPEGAAKPLVITAANEQDPHIIAAVHSKQNDAVFERRFADYELRARLRAIDGAGAIIISGAKRGEIKVELDIQKTASRGINPVQLSQIIGTQTQDIPAGTAREGEKEITVISKASIDSYNELKELVVAAPSPVKIGELASVKESEAPQQSIFVVNGIEQTALEIFRRPGANPARLSADVRDVIKTVNTTFERDIEVNIIYDDAPYILASIKSLCTAALASAAVVIAVLFFFIRSVKFSFIAALSILVSAASAFMALALSGRTLNSMSLSGLALGLGLVSDTSVIIIDALESAQPRKNEIASCAAALSASSFGGAATTAVVFIPVIFLPGPLGALFGDLAVALVASVISGWLYAQFALPSLAATGKWRPEKRAGILKHNALSCVYEAILRGTMARPLCAIFTAGLISVVGIFLVYTRPAAFITNEAAREIIIDVIFPAGTRLETIADESSEIINELKLLNYFEPVFARAGAEDEDAYRRAQSSYQKEKLVIHCLLKPEVKPDAALRDVNTFIESYSLNHQLELQTKAAYSEDKTAKLLGLSGVSVFAVRGSNVEETNRTAQTVVSHLRESGVFSAVNLEPAGKRNEYRIYPRREVAAMLGVDAASIARQAAQLTEGFIAGRLENESHPLDIRVTGAALPAFGAYGISQIPIALTKNGLITLGGAGRVERESSRLALARLDRGDVLYIYGETLNKNKSNLENVITKLENEIPEFSITGESAFKRYKTSLVITLIFVLMLLYLTLGAQFESFLLPLIFLLSVPFALAGIGPALFISSTVLDSGSAIALVALFGLVVNNGIVLYEKSAEKAALGINVQEAVIEGAVERLRPVLATTITTIIVLLPPALAPLGATQKSMAITMLGGCAASTALTIFVMPLILARFLRRNRGVKHG